MSVKYLKGFEVSFLFNHQKEHKMTYNVVSNYMRKPEAFTKKRVKRYLEVGNMDDMPDNRKKRSIQWIDDQRRENSNNLPEILAEVWWNVFISDSKSCLLKVYNDPKNCNKLCSAEKRQNNVTRLEWSVISQNANALTIYGGQIEVSNWSIKESHCAR